MPTNGTSRKKANQSNRPSRNRQGTPRGAAGLTSGADGVIRHRAPDYPLSGAVHRFVNMIPIQFIQSATTTVYGAASFTAASSGDFTSRAAVFDQYRIESIDLVLKPMTQLPQPGASGAVALSLLYFAIDLDDDTPPTTAQEVLDYQNVSILAGGQGAAISFKPTINVAGYSVSGYTNAVQTTNAWIDCSNPSVKHYGAKWCTTASIAAQTHTWILFARLHLGFKNPR